MGHQPGENRITPAEKPGLTPPVVKPALSGRSPKARFRVFGEEIIEKEVKSSGNSGRVYLPLDWVGKHVKIIRID